MAQHTLPVYRRNSLLLKPLVSHTARHTHTHPPRASVAQMCVRGEESRVLDSPGWTRSGVRERWCARASKTSVGGTRTARRQLPNTQDAPTPSIDVLVTLWRVHMPQDWRF